MSKHRALEAVNIDMRKKGYAEIQDKDEDFCIAVDVYQGRGETYKPRDTALINIKFPDGKSWSGSIDELKELIKTEL